MIGTSEAYAAADSLIARHVNDKPLGTVSMRDLLALAYMDGLVDGVREHETVDTAWVDHLRAKTAWVERVSS